MTPATRMLRSLLYEDSFFSIFSPLLVLVIVAALYFLYTSDHNSISVPAVDILP